MDETNRRSGMDRRDDRVTSSVDMERREGTDRRSVVSETDRMIEFLRKIPVFNGLTYDQYKKILYICYNKMLPSDCYIYEENDKSDSMYILLKGQLRILYNKSTVITTVDPISLFGEIGFFSGDPRKTSAVTTMESSIIKINRIELFRVFHGDSGLSNRILMNVIKELALKLDKYTGIIQELRAFKDSHAV